MHAEFGKVKPKGKKDDKPAKKETIRERIKNAPMLVKVGAGVGTAALVLVGAPAVIPVLVGGAGMTAYYKWFKKPGKYSDCMTAERIKVYEQAIATLKDSRKLRILADEFEKQGCKKEAEHLRKRAALRELPPADKARNKKLYKKGMRSKDPDYVTKAAKHFEDIAADGAARHLRIREKSLRALAA